MTAQEMFEELGFKQTICINDKLKEHIQIEYEKAMYDYAKIKVLFFDTRFYAQLYYKEDGVVFKNVGGCAIYKELLDAINKQCQELGWIE